MQGNRNLEVALLLSCHQVSLLPAGVCLQTRNYFDFFFFEGSGCLLIARHSSTHQSSLSTSHLPVLSSPFLAYLWLYISASTLSYQSQSNKRQHLRTMVCKKCEKVRQHASTICLLNHFADILHRKPQHWLQQTLFNLLLPLEKLERTSY